MQKIIKATIQLILSLSMILVSASNAWAYTLVDGGALKFDKTLVASKNFAYDYPSKLLITQVTSPNEQITKDSKKWVNMLYYHFITQLGFADLPYNYLVDREGNVYQGHSGGETVSPELNNGEGAILIGYLSNSSDISLSAQTSLKELVEEISYKYGLSRQNTDIVDLSMVEKTSTTSLSKLAYKSSTALFAKNLVTQINKYSYYSESHLSYTASLNKKEIVLKGKAGTKLPVEIDIKNESKLPWYTDRFIIYVTTDNGADSNFAVNGVWDSFSSPLSLDANTVLPGEVRRVSFDMQAPLIAGMYAETFKFKIINGPEISNSTFTVKFEAEKGDFTLVRIKDTGAGFLNVHKDGFISSPNIAQVPVGKIYIVEQVVDNWYKIVYSEGKSGWVTGQYVEVL